MKPTKHILIYSAAAAVLSVSFSAASAEAAENFSFSDLKNYTFTFASGAGAWGNTFSVDEGGNFSGSYHDSEMGSIGEGFPNGTVYWCNYSGYFTDLEMIDSLTCKAVLKDLQTEEPENTTEILDEIQYISTLPYGLENTSELLLYFPGTPVHPLFDDAMTGLFYDEDEDGFLDVFAFYSIQDDAWFVGYEYSDAYSEVLSDLNDTAKIAAAIRQRLSDESLDQQQINDLSNELYQTWDDVLNRIWAVLKQELDEETMASVTQDELAWIDAKEAEVETILQEYGTSAGTAQAALRAAELTEQRAYILSYYLN